MLIPPSFGGIRRWVSTRIPLAVSRSRTIPSRRTFWKTPPVNTTVPSPSTSAMADAFEDRLQYSLNTLQKDETIAKKIDVHAQGKFVGFDAYQKLLGSGVDVVLLCTPPGFDRSTSRRLSAALLRRSPSPSMPRRPLEAQTNAARKGPSLVSGLCRAMTTAFARWCGGCRAGVIGRWSPGQRLPGNLTGKSRQPG
jgi:hypothetical protein